MNSHLSQPIYIHGCGFHSALGATAEQIHHALQHNHSAQMQQAVDQLNTGTTTIVGRVSDALPELPSSLREYDSRNNRLALSALQQIEPVIQEAIRQYGADRIAVVIGTSTSGIADGENAFEQKLSQEHFPRDYHYRKQELGNVSDFIADYFQLTGPCYAISTACSSSGRVFISAKRLLLSGMADAVIVGGADTLCRLTLNGFNGLEALSNQHCQPFSADRSGINIGEGAAFMLLSKAPSEIALLGCGDSSDAHHISAPHPEGNGAEEAMKKALLDANLKPEQIGYVNAHGTATPLNDSMESKAIFRLFGSSVPVSSTKHLTGHTLGAASAVEAAIAWHILKYNLDLPQQGCQNKADDIEVTLVEQPMKLAHKAILSNSFAFGGNNISLIFGYPHE
ncbi:beta-ketoacyl-[acyl-carrier-protein] synthase family protein [Vibrio vulnificus]|uniref:beta-ketoacyl-[acyl-carrier-protein] synthase family protein n=1 Tax=Vibrio vulnificus TaxID=672 RepID=UPI00102A8C50|nr:beta-ketoacyl-[acyl-carrier-protein] synthase family protein [Vibrio vulnificus]EHU9446175.1 beta-ketoacyl-[acyl-carrier-protein] synthase family protein [Vibrio vulnificus]QNE00469.1 beta-ketoacyl-[acyl-carrier-protein] synthase family protein [Vibrio vulnificus]RZQ02957.1 beta-ketoacyl-[acyl-carrier-protein] synthase family protein [Vibrio vulnificus]